MAQETIVNQGTYQPTRADMEKIDSNFTELYSTTSGSTSDIATNTADIATNTGDIATINTGTIVYSHRQRVTVAEINAGASLLAAITGKSYRLISCKAIAYGGAAGAVTTVDILGTQSASGVKLVAYAQAALTQSAVLTDGDSNSAVLADGASYAACDAATAITIGKTGSDVTTATGVDVILQYTIE